MIYDFGGIEFDTKKMLKDFIRLRMIENGDGLIEEGTELNAVLSELLPHYSKFARKAAAGLWCYSVCTVKGGSKGINIVRQNGDEVPISPFAAVDELGKSDVEIVRKRVLGALRNEVRSQLDELRKPGFDVHHEPPEFRDIVVMWMVAKGLTWNDIEVGEHRSRYHRPLADRTLATSWQNFHKRKAKLVAIPTEVHRRMKRCS